MGKEFHCAPVAKVCKKYGVSLFSTHSNMKAALVERFNQTIMNRISRYFTQNNTKTYINVLPEIIRGYNQTYHSSIKMKPDEVNADNQHEAWFNSNQSLYNSRKRKSCFSKDDFVRIVINKNIFEKGYKKRFFR